MHIETWEPAFPGFLFFAVFSSILVQEALGATATSADVKERREKNGERESIF